MKSLFEKMSFLILEKGEADMAAVYVALIVNGRRTFASVPATLKEAVRQDLIALGLEELTK